MVSMGNAGLLRVPLEVVILLEAGHSNAVPLRLGNTCDLKARASTGPAVQKIHVVILGSS
jgi:hypothetical protein